MSEHSAKESLKEVSNASAKTDQNHGKICPKCGEANRPNASRCCNCGEEIRNIENNTQLIASTSNNSGNSELKASISTILLRIIAWLILLFSIFGTIIFFVATPNIDLLSIIFGFSALIGGAASCVFLLVFSSLADNIKNLSQYRKSMN